MQPWQLWVDTGGTFTDCIGVDPGGRVHRIKVLSSGAVRAVVREVMDDRTVRVDRPWDTPPGFFDGYRWDTGGAATAQIEVAVARDEGHGVLHLTGPGAGAAREGEVVSLHGSEEPPILAARILTRTPAPAALPAIEMRLATTRATNALLERRGGRVAFFVTRGLRDLLLIGDQTRPELFSLTARRPPPLYEHVFEVRERLSADGSILEPLDVVALRASAAEARGLGMEIAAVALMHGYANSVHEDRVDAILREAGFTHISRSSAIAPFIKILHRAETAIANAYVAPVVESYVARIESALAAAGSSRLRLLTSAGGLVSFADAHPKDCLLSGPAGGVVGAARAGLESGFPRIIGFDMGGTSTDVCRFSGDYEYRFEQRIGDARIVAPALAIETVAAGGGSICAWRFGRLIVGPESAGAEPGPACYGRGGPLTITDVNLLLGRIDPARFEIPIEVQAAELALESVRRAIERDLSDPPSREQLLEGFLEIADERMADAIARVSLRRGFDPREHALVAFGGAGGQHACRVAELLGIEAIVFPRDASLLSALGLGFARVEQFAQRHVLRGLDELTGEFATTLEELEQEAIALVARQGVDPARVDVTRRIVSARLHGQVTSLDLDITTLTEIEPRFRAIYRARYGHEPVLSPEKGIEIESLRVVAASDSGGLAVEGRWDGDARIGDAERIQRCYAASGWRDVPVIARDPLRDGSTVEGPALIAERSTMLVIEPGWRGEIDAAGAVVARRARVSISGALTPGPSPRGRGEKAHSASRSKVVERDLFAARFTALAEEMGEMLERTAVSTNVKERRDFSCALIDRNGTLLVNAPHIPVHLGSLGICVRAVRDRIAMKPGDVIVTNHPAFGGSHLPDVTIITPAFDGGGLLLGYAASRAHHAEIGGARPGSMPPDATTLEEEGVVVPPMYLVRGGVAQFGPVENVLRHSKFPSRAVADNLADMRAAVAANQRGAAGLAAMVAAHGAELVQARMRDLADHAATLAAEAIARLPFESCSAQEALDDGSPIVVRLDRRGDRLHVDFTGSAGQHPGNLNATPAIVSSAVIYVLRLLIGEMLPLNEGIMRQVSLEIPGGMLNPDFGDDPRECPAVVGGNTEVSQRVVDTLLKALGLCAASQGTMNNILFGDAQQGYYETICGGGGAGPEYDGADAVQCHMTNTRITDPEILERRHPVRLNRFAIRPGSGGAGRHHGGNGVTRDLTFLAPQSLSVLTQRRVDGPFGMAGGAAGEPGSQRVVRADGSTFQLRSIDGCEVNPCDRLIVETPGGGGYGEKSR